MSISHVIHATENDFSARFGFSLFSYTPVSQLTTLNNRVSNRDDFISRILSACAIFDHLNKKEMDKEFGTPPKGSRKSFELFLKSKAVNNQIFIDDKIVNPMGMICLLRDYLTHGRNRNKAKAIKYFNIQDPIVNYEESWGIILNVYKKLFESILTLLSTIELELLSSKELNEETELGLIKQYFSDFSYYFEDRRSALMLKEVIESGPITDSELSVLFNISPMDVRRGLYPYSKGLLIIKYHGVGETIITLSPYFYEHKELLFNVIKEQI